jgi:hypothetical protein
MKPMLSFLFLLFSLIGFGQNFNLKNFEKRNYLLQDRHYIQKHFGDKFDQKVDITKDFLVYDLYTDSSSIRVDKEFFIYFYELNSYCISYRYFFPVKYTDKVIEYLDKKTVRCLEWKDDGICWIDIIKVKNIEYVVYRILSDIKTPEYCNIITIEKILYDSLKDDVKKVEEPANLIPTKI